MSSTGASLDGWTHTAEPGTIAWRSRSPRCSADTASTLCDVAAELGELGAIEKLGVELHRG
jgi:hypothetical protein